MKTISRYIMTLALLLTAVTGAWAQDTYTVAGSNSDMFGYVWDPANTANDMTKNGDGTYSITYTNVNFTENEEVQYKVVKNHSWNEAYPAVNRVINIVEAGTYTLTIHFNPTTHEVYETMPGSGSADPNTIEVTTNAPSAQDLFTEASFTMPTFDATVNYDIVRDMQDEANPVAFSGLPSSGNIVVKKGGDGKYQPAEALTLQLIDPLAAAEAQNIIAADGITIKVLVGDDSNGPVEYDDENPITLDQFLADTQPGFYWIKAVPTDETTSPYIGTVYSSEFTAVEQYDLTVNPANDFSKNRLDAVTVGTGSVTIDANTGEAAKTGIAPNTTEVKIKAKTGYIITVTNVNGVSYNEAKTEATFTMPQSDVTATYTIKRDMSVQMTAQVGDGTQEQPRYRVKKDGNNTFIPADMEMAAVPALFTVNDAIEQKALTQTQDYIVQIYAIDAEGQPTGDAMDFTNFTFEPGIYAVKAVAADGSDYAGETALSNTFKLFQGYEVTVGAGEYATFYKDENLYTEDEDAELYTIASVTDTEAVLSDAITVAPAETPLLVYNKSEQDKTFLLIPTTDDADEVIPAKEFKGSITSGELPASSSTADYYALNGKAFVWVKYAIAIGANKCWLQISNQPAAARAMTRSIVGGNGTTGIDAIENVTIDNEGWYDLQGRKLQSAPNRKGIYIHNGKKVVIR